jgi:type IV pilus assembly protein PilY1
MNSKNQLQIVLSAAFVGALVTIAHFSNAAPPTTIDMSLRQEPLTAVVNTPSNVILMMDDSSSMNAIDLPPPEGIDFSTYGTTEPVTVPNNISATAVAERDDFHFRNSFFNPLYYNPAITYKPWNDNNKAAALNFPNADIGADVAVDATQDDMRFVIIGGVKTRASVTRTDLFTRSSAVRTFSVTPPCTSFTTQTVCTSNAPGTTTTTIDPNSETGTITSTTPGACLTTGTVPVCAAPAPAVTTTAPGLVPARYLRFEGTGVAQLKDNTKYRLVEIDRAATGTNYPTPIDPVTGNQTERGDCLNPTLCTFTEEAKNYANWYTYYRTRLFAAIGVTSQVLSETEPTIRIGYGRLAYFAGGPDPWPSKAVAPATTSDYKPPAALPLLDGQTNPGHIVRGVRPFTLGSADRQEIFDWLFGLAGVGGTPLREALDSVGKYFQRTDAKGPWANNPGVGDASTNSQLACRRNFSIFATDGTWTDSPNHPRLSATYPSLPVGSPAESDSIDGTAISGAGNQAGRSYQYLLTEELALSSVGAAQNQTLADVAHYYWSHDLRPDLPNVLRPAPWAGASGVNYPKDYYDPATWQSLTNYFVGYGLSTSVSKSTALTGMKNNVAVNWPAVTVTDPGDRNKTSDTLRAALASRGDFYAAQDPTQLAESLRKAFANVGKTRGSASALAVSSSVISQTTDLVFEASFDSSDWTGRLRGLNARDLVVGSSTEVWEAALPTAFSTRKIFTTSAISSPLALTWVNLTPAQQATFTNEDEFKYFLGDQSKELPIGTLRKRSATIGSIVGSGPLYSGATTYGHNYKPGAVGSSYPAYLDWKKATRRPVVFAGSNYGYYHAFDAADGQEVFSFTPRSAIPYLADISKPTYVHRFLVDGLSTEGDAYFGGAWHTVVLGSSGSGPKSLFLLDVTNPATFNASNVKWEVNQTDEPDMGHILGGGMIASTKTGKWVVIVGNGYGSQNDDAALLVFDLETGALLKKLIVPAGSVTPKPKNGMGPPTAVYDSERNVSKLYAGDKLGNLWKFDVSDGNPANWTFANTFAGADVPLFSAKDPSGAAQPITTAPRVLQHPLGGLYVTFGTGKVFEQNDETNTQTQSIYAIRDQGSNATYTKSQLLQGSLVDVPGDLRAISGLTGPGGLDWNVHKGWYLNLPVGGTAERIIASPKLQAGMAVFTSFNPENSDPCEVGGKSYVYTFDLATNFTREVFRDKGPTIVATRTFDGLVGGTTSLYAPAAAAAPVVNSISAADLKNSIKNTRFTLTGGQVKDGGPSSYCAQAGNSITNQTLTIPSACAGTAPLRVWRDLK